MGYDPVSRIYRPDFEADNALPQWVPMGGEGGTSGADSFVGALKARMNRPKTPDVQMPDAKIPTEDIPIPEAPLPDFGPRTAAPVAAPISAATRPRTTGGMGGGGGSL